MTRAGSQQSLLPDHEYVWTWDGFSVKKRLKKYVDKEILAASKSRWAMRKPDAVADTKVEILRHVLPLKEAEVDKARKVLELAEKAAQRWKKRLEAAEK